MKSIIEKPSKEDSRLPEGERYFGFVNDNNICYANSAIQILYHCKRFRQKVISYQIPKSTQKDAQPLLILELQELFQEMDSQNLKESKKGAVTLNTKKLMKRIKSLNELFNNEDHHDSHEFMMWLLNTINDEMAGPQSQQRMTFVREVFEGKLVSRTRCLECECGGERDETFLALSVDIDKGHSLNQCIKQFAHKEWMLKQDKFFCENCHTKQVATRQMMIKSKPRSLIIHLKRFRIDYRTNHHQKLGTRIPFPQELRIESALDDISGENHILYNLTGIVVHMGQGYAYGHYFALVKSKGRWIKFDDTSVEPVDEKYMRALFGNPQQSSGNQQETTSWPSAYMLLYDAVDERSQITDQ
ncbi:hypothetical protein FGO68_gene10338 [Halteria grandinella]|uniref:ubiquitinyl hydrolase 1 n=1 Tax=Halteria grandinella TaxID=5974 RepID=A0A8J8NM46_HALGN|nr:hypothetical protein FGO68_gene10338 [Halteria grandinella]